VREVARIAFERGTGARGLRLVVEEVMEGVLFEVEAGIRYVVNEQVRSGEAVRHSMAVPRATLGSYLWCRHYSRASSMD
jgi:ATP-dependent protease Clp ATPase subunit